MHGIDTIQRKRGLSSLSSTDESNSSVESNQDHYHEIDEPKRSARACLKSGKWTADEENLANRLIIEFQSGTLDDCQNGATLRSYLSRRLHCAPMRISKKFAGRCIGKVFLSRFSNDTFHVLP